MCLAPKGIRKSLSYLIQSHCLLGKIDNIIIIHILWCRCQDSVQLKYLFKATKFLNGNIGIQTKSYLQTSNLNFIRFDSSTHYSVGQTSKMFSISGAESVISFFLCETFLKIFLSCDLGQLSLLHFYPRWIPSN